jgi:hypothetical protein
MSSFRTLSALAALVAVASVHGCSAAADGFNLPLVIGTGLSSSTQLPFTRVLSTVTSGFSVPVDVVIRDQAALDAAWHTLFLGVAGSPIPTVDFTQKMVVLLALGPRETGGYAIHFDSIGVQAGLPIVSYTVNTPGLNCVSVQFLTSPVDVVLVPRVDGQTRFDARTILQEC